MRFTDLAQRIVLERIEVGGVSNRRLHVYASMQKLLDIECEMSLGFSFVMKIRLLLLRYFVYLFFIQAIWLPMTGIPCYGQGLAHIMGNGHRQDGAAVLERACCGDSGRTGTATEVVVNDNGTLVFRRYLRLSTISR